MRGADRPVAEARGWRNWLASTTGMLAVTTGILLYGSPAAAQQASPPGRVGQQMLVFDIPAQDLNSALLTFIHRAGLQVVYDVTLVAGLRSAPLNGRYTPTEGLARLLAGTGITYRLTGTNTLSLEKSPADHTAGQGAIQLPSVRVERPLPSGDGAGYVATRGTAGTKTDTPLSETPQAVSVITRTEMDARGVQTVTDALRYTPGMFTQPFGTDQRFDQAYIRGFTATGTGDYRDGLRQPLVNFSGFRTDPYGLSRIEVLKGPASVLYGQSQPGGVINRVSKLPTQEPFHEVRLQGGSHDAKQGAFDLSGPLDSQGEFLARIVGLARDSDHPLYEQLSDDRQFLAPSFTWQPSADTALTLLASYQNDETFTFKNFVKSISGLPQSFADAFRDNYVGEPNWDRFDQRQWSLGYRFEHRFSDTWTVRQNLRYGDVETDFRQLEIASLDAFGNLGRSPRRWQEDMQVLAVDSQIQASFSTGPLAHKALLGFDVQTIDWEQDNHFAFNTAPATNIFTPVYGQSVPMPPVISSDRQDLDQYGVYLQDQIRLADKWVLTLGGRHDWAKRKDTDRLTEVSTSQDDAAFTGRAGLTYLSDIGLAPYISYSESFVPTTGTDRSGQAFDPTEGRQYELGVKYQPTGIDSFLTVSAFDLTQINVLTPDPTDINFSVQTGEIQSRGIEVEAVADLGAGLDMTASYAFQDAEVTKSNSTDLGKTPLFSPKHTASLWGDYTVADGDFTGLGAGLGIRYVGRTYADTANTLTNPSMRFVDASLHYDLDHLAPGLAGVRLALNATNLFDRDYSICSSGACYRMDGRTVMGTLQYRW